MAKYKNMGPNCGDGGIFASGGKGRWEDATAFDEGGRRGVIFLAKFFKFLLKKKQKIYWE